MKSLKLVRGRAVIPTIKIPLQLWLLAILLSPMLLQASSTVTEDCQGISIHLPAEIQNEVQHVCIAAQQAVDTLRQCGIESSKVIDITIQAQLTHVSGLPVFAFFYSPKNQIFITDYESFKKLIIPDSAYHKLPTRDLYASLIAHEVTHALTCQFIAESECSRVALEYLASVVQVSSMSNDARQILLDYFPRTSPVDLEMFNEFTFYSSPQWFVANAYRHFNQLDNGCEFLRDIISGKVQFLGGFDFE